MGLCLLDGALVGYRTVCGRTALVRRHRLDRCGIRLGIAAGLAVVAALAVWFGAVLAVADDPKRTIAGLTASGARMLAVYAAMAAVTTVALAVYAWAPPRWGSLSMVTVLGPLTLLRPVVLAAGAAAGVLGSGAHRVPVLASVGVVLVAVAIETLLLDRWGATLARTGEAAWPCSGPANRMGR